MRKLLTTLFLFSLPFLIQAQMLMGTDTLYGNEWIQFDQSYFKIPITEDGLYRMTRAELESAGIPMSTVDGNQLRLYHLGQEIPVYVSNGGNLSDNDYLLFWGEQNRGELDQYLFADPEEEQLNPYYSLVTDTSHYFLTWNTTAAASRYQTIDLDLTQAPAKEEWVWRTERQVFSEKFMKNYARRSGITIYFSNYDVAEGYGNRNINELLASGATTQDFNIDLPYAYLSGPQAQLEARFGVGNGDHQQIVKVDGNTYFDRSYTGVAVKTPSFNFPLADDRAAVSFEGLKDDRDEQSISYIQVQYPSLPDAGNQSVFSFEVDGGAAQKYIEISGFNATNGIPVLYDLTHHLRIICKYENGVVKALLPAHDAQRSLVLLEEERSATAVPAIESHIFTDLLAQAADYLLLTSPLLRTPYESEDQVQAYADYRQSPAGGSYSPEIVEIQDIYDQFGYGLHRHPQSIRNFVHAAHRRWPNLKYVFLIGKGREYTALRSAQGLKDAIDAQTYFVPSFGFPASDNLMLSNNSSSVAVVPVGRIAATTPKEINIYLNKVRNLEATVSNGQTIEERAWMKNIIHLGGGGSSGEQVAIKNNLERMAGEIEGNLFGGKVTPFYKTSTDPIQQSRSEQIFDRINEGTAVITFFGHSSPGTFDFNIDNPDNYENFGKFPLILSLGCYSGNFFTSSRGIGERFTFYEDKASVAFGASRGVGFISTLGGFADRFYEKMGGEKYGAGIGDIVSATRRSLDHLTGLEIKTVVQQFSMMGDPAIRLHPSPGPDYVVDRSSVQFSPKVISIQEDTFQLEFDVLNLGQFIQDSITVDIRQKLPGGEELKVKSFRISTPAYSSHHSVNLATQGKPSIGLNTFFVEVDVQNEVDELPTPSGEMNNSLVRTDGQAGVNLFIVDNTAQPVFPPQFGLVGSAPVILKSSTSDALAPDRKYLIEIDTTHLFNSPVKERSEIVQQGGVVKWTPTLPLQDSTVYYWRISPDSTEAEVGYVWENRSFTYIEGSPPGWVQGHYGQFLENAYQNLALTANGLEFDVNGFFITIRNKLNEPDDPPAFIYNLGGSAASVRPWNIIENGIAVAVLDAANASGWINPPGGLYGSVNNSQTRVFSFPTNTFEGRKNLLNFIEEVIPSGSYVFFFSVLNTLQGYNADQWEQDAAMLGTDIFTSLEAQGATLIRQLSSRGVVPYTLIYQKNRGVFAEDIGSDLNELLFTEVFIPRRRSEGKVRSRLIGPAKSWESVRWRLGDHQEGDEASLNIYGLNIETMDTFVVAKNLLRQDTSLESLNAELYPYLSMELNLSDETGRTAPNLKDWTVYFEGLPDLAVSPAAFFVLESDTVLQGKPLHLSCRVENLSSIPMDTVSIRFTLEDSQNSISSSEIKWNPVAGLQQRDLEYFLETEDMQGPHVLTIELNTDRLQNELHYFNNFLTVRFFVQGDIIDPLLDVTFDGIHIQDKDLVSSEPVIELKLFEENPYVLLQDTSSITVYLQRPNEQAETRLYYRHGDLMFDPAIEGERNEAQVSFQPSLLQDGEYVLRVVAKDIAGNKAGNSDFKISFQVINQSLISNFLNYPNPFSTATKFAYTLTGSTAPERYQIRIMTVSGQVVRILDGKDLGPLRVGTHLTDFAWDGTDEFGDRLANGVYLYQIYLEQNNSREFDNLETAIDSLFAKDIGKLVILR